MSLLMVSQSLLWAVIFGLIIVVCALARQIGMLHERIAPVGALVTGGGPAVGTKSPLVVGRLIDGGMLVVGERLAPGRTQLLLFVSSECPVCKKVVPVAKSVAAAEKLDLVFVGDDTADRLRQFISKWNLQDFPFINGPELGMSFQVGKLPFGIVLDENGQIAAKGLVNTREHLESLVVARNIGFGTVQSYVRHQAARLEASSS